MRFCLSSCYGIAWTACAYLMLYPCDGNTILHPVAKRSVEHRAEKKADREEKKQYKEEIAKNVQEMKELDIKTPYEEVKRVVIKVRDSINAYNFKYGHDLLTREKFSEDFHKLQMAQRAESREARLSRHATRRFRRQIVDIMFPESAKTSKHKFCVEAITDQEMGELHDKYCVGSGTAMARDIGWCSVGVGLCFFPSERMKQAGACMILSGGYGAYCTFVNTVVPYFRDWEQTPASEADKEYLRQIYNDRNLYREPFYNMEFVE